MDNETFDKVLNGFKEADSIVKKLKARIAELEEENKNLKSDLAFERTMLDNVRAEYKSLQNVIKKLKAENEYLHKLLPEADWYIIEKQLEQRLWNDWEEDVYEY